MFEHLIVFPVCEDEPVTQADDLLEQLCSPCARMNRLRLDQDLAVCSVPRVRG